MCKMTSHLNAILQTPLDNYHLSVLKDCLPINKYMDFPVCKSLFSTGVSNDKTNWRNILFHQSIYMYIKTIIWWFNSLILFCKHLLHPKKTSGQRELLTNAAKYNTCICIKKTHSGTNIVAILQNLSMD